MEENADILNFDRLTGRIIEKFKTRENFANNVPTSIPTLINKLNGKVDFKSSEILRFCKLLNISIEQIPYFFYDIT